MKTKITEEQMDAEIATLLQDEDVKAFRRANAKRQQLYQLRWMKKKGQELRKSSKV